MVELMRMGNARNNKDPHRISATGDTFKDVPMTSRRSTFSRSSARELSNSSVNFSPKNVISGYSANQVVRLSSLSS